MPKDLRHLTVSHDKIERLLKIGEEHGAIAGKFTEEDVAVACSSCARFTNCQKIVAAVEKQAQHIRGLNI